ncbi:unnamed protein product [Clavelina lepadiformis]|uniref:Golgin-45 n=1 Tax=Clavelina lepadiformis TaxID=159417 RepID=A0ABP0FX08_CLALP
MESSSFLTKPSLLHIDRDPSWPSVPREVGDGMESTSSSIQSVSVSPRKSPIYKTMLPLSMEVSSLSSSRTTSPVPQEQEVKRHTQFCLEQYSSLDASVSSSTFNASEQCLIEEKEALKDHLQIQIQVNQELKRLLVASVGDDLGYHYERLSTEKAQLSREVDELQKLLEAKKEEMERLEISCDVWRSKFQASRVQCEDLSSWKRSHERKVREMESGVRGLLREHWDRSEHLDHIFRTLKCVNAEVQKKISNEKNRANMADPSCTTAEKCRKLTNALSSHFLQDSQSNLKPPSSTSDYIPEPTPAEKYVLQLLSENQKQSASNPVESSPALPFSPTRKHHFSEYKLDRAINRLHSYAGCDSITVTCCNKCKGDIYVV